MPVGNSLFQALSWCGGLQKRGGDEWGLVGKKERLLAFLIVLNDREPLNYGLQVRFLHGSWSNVWQENLLTSYLSKGYQDIIIQLNNSACSQNLFKWPPPIKWPDVKGPKLSSVKYSKWTPIKQSPTLSGRGHLLVFPMKKFSTLLIPISQPQ